MDPSHDCSGVIAFSMDWANGFSCAVKLRTRVVDLLCWEADGSLCVKEPDLWQALLQVEGVLSLLLVGPGWAFVVSWDNHLQLL